MDSIECVETNSCGGGGVCVIFFFFFLNWFKEMGSL